jgi:hypothetical protein
MKHLATYLLLATVTLQAQRSGTYSVEYKKVLSSSANIITVQLAANAGKSMRMLDAWVESSSAACEVTAEWTTALATGTALTVNALPGSGGSTATAYRDSDVAAGTILSRFTVQSSSGVALNVSDIALTPGRSFTLRSASCTTTLIINLKWSEQ